MTTNELSGIQLKRRWTILGVVYLCILSFAITLQAVPPVLTLIIRELKLSHAQGGLLMSLFALPGIAISIPAGMLADRYGQKLIGLASFILVITGIAIVATGNSFPTLALGRIISGAGAITLMIISPQLLAQWFAGREIGIAMGVYSTGMPLGTILSLNFLSQLGANLGWRASIWVSIILPAASVLIFLLLFAPAPRKIQKATPPRETIFLSLRRTGAPIWIIGIAWLLFNAAVISLFTFTPDLLTSAGISPSQAGFITSAVMWPALVLSPLVGYLMDRIGQKQAIIASGGITLAILIPFVPSATGWILGLMLLIGAAQTLVPAPILALPPEATSPERLGLGFGIISTCLNLGILLGPASAGFVRDISGSYQQSYALMAGFMFFVAVAMIVLRWKQSKMRAR
ncbi:MAG: MFS transporter [Chloroflexi bacterium]|nr:MFS transporter [Chloroflexota bacterium]